MSGKGNEILRNAGVKIIGPVLRAECEYFSRGFVSVRTKGRPFITLKRALARDGSFANPEPRSEKRYMPVANVAPILTTRC
jgi:diaminohydroxyphosphoribosylaminopyrimidine deaminase/5-amino-6-(5-phosphoribosylamino)uracil reductase